MAQSSIEWTEMTWNPTVGCTKVSQGCKFCYAEVMHKRLQGMGKATGMTKYENPFTTVLPYPAHLNLPAERKTPTTYFVNSMSDLFHESLPIEYIQQVFQVMNNCPQHTFQVLTKRAYRLRDTAHLFNWTPNIWMGVSVEHGGEEWRIDCLRKVPAAVRFISAEPLIAPLLNIDLTGIQWVIVGGESGRKARPIQEQWVNDILSACRYYGAAFFFKQWGGKNKKMTGRQLNGRTYDEMPSLTTSI